MSLFETQLPDGLRWVTVRDFYEVTRKPRNLSRPESGLVPFIPMERISQDGSFEAACLQKPADSITSGTYFERGDILVAKITPSFENGKQALVEELSNSFGYATTEVIPLHAKGERQDHRVLFYYLLHSDVRSHVAGKMEGSTGRQRVPEGVLLDLPFPEFEDAEQKAIADALELVQSSIRAEHDAFKGCQELRQTAMRVLFTRGLRGELQKATDIGDVPESWNIVSLSSVARIERGRFLHRPRNEPRFYGGATPFIQTGDVVRSRGRLTEFSQTLNEDGVAISRVFPKGTILLTIAANIGYTGILGIEAACPDSLVAITPSDAVDVLFLEYFLQTQQPVMDQRAPKGTQKNINIQFLNPWPVPLPDVEEQREIAAILDAIDQKIDLHRQKKAVLEELFRTLLHKLMTGEVRVSDLDLSALETASAVEMTV